MDKESLSERDICTKFITPAIEGAGWDIRTQVREEITFTAGRVIVRGRMVSRGKAKRADYVLYYKPNIPIALIEAKDNKHTVDSGMQQALSYGETLDIPFVFSSNGDAFLEHDRTVTSGPVGLFGSLWGGSLWGRAVVASIYNSDSLKKDVGFKVYNDVLGR